MSDSAKDENENNVSLEINEQIAEPVAEPIAEPVDEPVAEPVAEPVDEHVNEENEDDDDDEYTNQKIKLFEKMTLFKTFLKWKNYNSYITNIPAHSVKNLKEYEKISDNISNDSFGSSFQDSDIEDVSDANSDDDPEECQVQYLEIPNICFEDNKGNITYPTVIELDKYNKKFKKLNYNAVEKEINKYYLEQNHKYSAALDILASYLKGQKIIVKWN